MTDSQLLIIANPRAQGGKAKDTLHAYQKFLVKEDKPHFTYFTKEKNNYPHVNKLFELKTFHRVIIIGGDGTINLAVNALPQLDLPIVIIPAGSGNDLAKMIYTNGIPSIKQLFEMSVQDKTSVQTVDIWRCNDQLFINGFGCGFDGSIAYNAKYKKGIRGRKMKYWVEIVKHIFLYHSPTFSVNGAEQSTFMLSVANGKVYGGDFMVAPHADVSDSQLEIVKIQKLSVLKRLLNLPLMKKGGHLKKGFVSYHRANEVHIKSNVPLAAHLDGEPLNEKEYRVSWKGMVQVLV